MRFVGIKLHIAKPLFLAPASHGCAGGFYFNAFGYVLRLQYCETTISCSCSAPQYFETIWPSSFSLLSSFFCLLYSCSSRRKHLGVQRGLWGQKPRAPGHGAVQRRRTLRPHHCQRKLLRAWGGDGDEADRECGSCLPLHGPYASVEESEAKLLCNSENK